MDRLTKLLHIAYKVANAANTHLFIRITDTRVRLKTDNETVDLQCESVQEAVTAVEAFIKEKQPEKVLFTGSFTDLLDLYPFAKKIIGHSVVSGGLSPGDYTQTLQTMSLRHLLLFQHVHTFGRDTMANREKGINISDDMFQEAADDETYALGLLMAIELKKKGVGLYGTA